MIDFAEVPIIAPSARWVRVADDLSILLGQSEHRLLHGRDAAKVMSLVDGRRTKLQILLEAGEQVGDVAALFAFERLESRGSVVVAASSDVERTAQAFWHSHGVSNVAPLLDWRVTVDGKDPALVAEANAALAAVGLQPPSNAERAPETATRTLTVCVVDDYSLPELETENEQRLASGQPWYLVNPSAAAPWAGPLFEPGEGPCWLCLAHRLRGNRPLREHFRRTAKGGEPLPHPVASLAASRQVILGLAALAIARYALDPDSRIGLQQHVLSLDPATLRTRQNFVGRRPQCRACGDPTLFAAQMERPLTLNSPGKRRPHVGGYRRAQAEDTCSRYERLVNPHTGAVSFLSRLPRSSGSGVAVFVSGYLTPVEDGRLQHCARRCAGKGRTTEQARASALCEALERRSGMFEGDEPRIRSSLRELGPRALPPERLDGFSDRQYALRDELNAATNDPALWIPKRLSRDTPIDWVPAWSLSWEQRRYVPFTYCFSFGPSAAGADYCRPCGNGVAAGTCLEEAILQATLELVERDAVAIWWYNRVRRPAIDPLSLPKPVAALLASYRDPGAEAWLLDLTHDLGIPACAALGRRASGGKSVYSVGFGCHLDPCLAAERALTELHQLGDGLDPATGEPLLATDRLQDASFLTPSGAPPVDYAALPSFDGEHLRADVHECIRRLSERHLELIAVNKTRPDLGLPVVQVIAPGLRHMRPRLGPGRLYDVPLRMGWRQTPRSERTLTSVPLVL